MKLIFTLFTLSGSLLSFAQTGLELSCPASETIACIDALPPPNLDLLSVTTDCGVDYNGNPIDTTSSISGNGTAVCDTAYVACYAATPVSTTQLENGETRVEIEITYGTQAGCKHAVSHIAFSLPDGVSAVEFNEQDSYTGLLGTYNVENTTNNPYYSIKFESNGDGFEPGTKEVFVYTLPAGVTYEEVDILVKAATNRDAMSLSINCESQPSNPVDTVINYETFWIYDYINPGGTGCIGDPIIITRSYGASDACFNSYSCEQEFSIESECVDGVPQGCGSDTTGIQGRTTLPSNNIWKPEQAMYAVNFNGYEEHEGGYYSITKIWRPEGNGESVEDDRELGRLAPLWREEYSFAHESIEPTDSIRVEWVGETVAVSNTNSIQIQQASIYPNPGNDAFTISMPSALSGSAQVVVYDQIGRIHHRLSVSANLTSIELNGDTWTPGIYRVQVIDDAGSAYQATWIKQ